MLMPTVFHENLFDDFFDPFWNDAALERVMNREARDTFGKRGANMMKTDVKQTDNGYEVAVDLPGCKKEDVQMDLNDGYLTIQAVRSHSNDEKDKKGRYLRRESFSGTCARSFYVGDVKKEDIHAKFEDGVLHIELPAPQQTKALPENPNLIWGAPRGEALRGHFCFAIFSARENHGILRTATQNLWRYLTISCEPGERLTFAGFSVRKDQSAWR